MGWAYVGTDYYGRQIGYGISATCDKRGCIVVIDRGLGSICGEMHHGPFDDKPGCGMYFCDAHGAGMSRGCRHRQKQPYGKTFCQLLMHVVKTPTLGLSANDDAAKRVFACACGKWRYDGNTDGMTLDEWALIPGYRDHLATRNLVTDMQESGEEALYA